jgi:hypothetical protein
VNLHLWPSFQKPILFHIKPAGEEKQRKIKGRKKIRKFVTILIDNLLPAQDFDAVWIGPPAHPRPGVVKLAMSLLSAAQTRGELGITP